MGSILVQFPGAESSADELRAIAGRDRPIRFLPFPCTDEEFREASRDAEAAFGIFPPRLFAGSPIRWLHLPSAGVDRYAKACLRHDIVLTNSSGVFGKTIAEHAVGLLLALARRFPRYIRNMDTRTWRDEGGEMLLTGGTALMLGTGNIGTEIARRLQAFGMRTVGLCRTDDRLRDGFDRIVRTEALDDVLPQADAVLCALPSTDTTRQMLDERRLGLMKPGAVLINVGRGDLIDTDALCALLRAGHFRGVGLDVTMPEPLPEEHPLWSFDNVIVTPHVAGIGVGHTDAVSAAIWGLFTDNLRRWCGGEPLRNVVDPELGY